MFNIYEVLILTLQKALMVKIIYCQIPISQ